MVELWIYIVDSGHRVVRPDQLVLTQPGNKQPVSNNSFFDQDHWVAQVLADVPVTLEVQAKGFVTQRHTVFLHEEFNQVVIGLPVEGELTYTLGQDRLAFKPELNACIMHVRGPKARQAVSALDKKFKLRATPLDQDAVPVEDEVIVRIERPIGQVADLTRSLSNPQTTVEFANIVRHDERPPLALGNELLVQFLPDVKPDEITRLAKALKLKVARPLGADRNDVVLTTGGAASYDILRAAERLIASGRTVFVEPNFKLILQAHAMPPLWAQVPHLNLVRATEAWQTLEPVRGSPSITIGIVDYHGVDPIHPDLTSTLSDGRGKMTANLNFVASMPVVQTVADLGGDHGTQCAGSATAQFNPDRGMSGVAPNAHLIGVRVAQLESMDRMAHVYRWLAGVASAHAPSNFPAPLERPADVISTSHGPTGIPATNAMRLCFEQLTALGRGGKGTVLCFSIGNPGYVEFCNPIKRNYLSWPASSKTIAVGSSINQEAVSVVAHSAQDSPQHQNDNLSVEPDTRSLFSPFGIVRFGKPDLVAPSHTAYQDQVTLIDPIVSTVRVGRGTLNGCRTGTCNDYAKAFGGTSHSTPMVAGAVALMLSVNPGLTWIAVHDRLRASCVRIDLDQAEPEGRWVDRGATGEPNFSRWYGFGRLDVLNAVKAASDG